MWQALGTAFWVYSALCAAFVVFSGFYFWRKPALNQLIAIIVLMLLVPPVSIDYTLMALLLIWGAVLIYVTQEEVPHAMTFLLPLALLLTPQSYMQIGGTEFGGQAKAILLLLLLGAAFRIDLPSRLFGDVLSARTR